MTENGLNRFVDKEGNPRSANILLVDNSSWTISGLRAGFSRVNYEGRIYGVETVADAIEQLKTSKVDYDGIITCGFKGDWVKIADYLEENDLDIPIHLLTVYEDRYQQGAKERGVPVFIKGKMLDPELERMFNFRPEILSNKPDDPQQ